jgi:FtsZ-binding cell division protein ZapB
LYELKTKPYAHISYNKEIHVLKEKEKVLHQEIATLKEENTPLKKENEMLWTK